MDPKQVGNNQELEYYKKLYFQEKQNNEKIKNELNSIKQNNQMLRNQLNSNNRHNPTFTEALNMHLANSILGNPNTDSNVDLGKIITDEMKENPEINFFLGIVALQKIQKC